MTKTTSHERSMTKTFGGEWQDCMEIHDFMDKTYVVGWQASTIE